MTQPLGAAKISAPPAQAARGGMHHRPTADWGGSSFVGADDAHSLSDMADTITPSDLAKELGLSPRTIREWLRAQGWQSRPYTRWQLTVEQATLVRAHFKS
jgi:hypothetical protein